MILTYDDWTALTEKAHATVAASHPDECFCAVTQQCQANLAPCAIQAQNLRCTYNATPSNLKPSVLLCRLLPDHLWKLQLHPYCVSSAYSASSQHVPPSS